jgi:hypothetical protein
MELPPEHNSFRRLLAYRIAHRFGLTHGVSDQLNEVWNLILFFCFSFHKRFWYLIFDAVAF